MRPLLRIVMLLALACGELASRPAVAGLPSVPTISIANLRIKDNVVPAKYKLSFNSKDPSIVAANFASMMEVGAHLNLCNLNVVRCSAFLSIPASGWKTTRKGFKYADKPGANGPVRSITVSDGKLVLRLAGAGFNFPLLGQPGPQGTLGFALWSNLTPVVCAQVPGSQGTVKRDSPAKGTYIAVKAEAPAICSNVVLATPPPAGCPAAFAGCTTFTVRTGAQQARDITFEPFVYTPKCLRVRVGQQVQFVGAFSDHPLQSACGGTIPHVTSGTSRVVTFTTPGLYGYYCTNHGTPAGADMAGAIDVVP